MTTDASSSFSPQAPVPCEARAAADSGLPAYARLLSARHRAHQPELEKLIEDLPFTPHDRILDVPCGDGFYSRCIASHLVPWGKIIAADVCEAVVRECRRRLAEFPSHPSVLVVRADVFRLPFPENCFDLVWCAQSFMSIFDPLAALREMRRVVRPEGFVAVLENDELHDVVLSWPADLELAVHQARSKALRERGESRYQLYVGRHLQDLFHTAGLEPLAKRTYPVDRRWPVDDNEREFLDEYFRAMWQDVRKFLSPDHARQVRRLIEPSSDEYLPDRPDFEMTEINALFLGRKRRDAAF